MKIRDVAAYVVGNPPPHYGGAFFVFVKLTADNGIHGFGEAYGVPFDPQVTVRMIEDVAERHFIGADPFRIEHLWRAVYGRGYTQHPDLSLMGVLSSLEMACWDIAGKALDKPVYQLLGGQVHEKLRSYTYLYPHPDTPEDWAVNVDPDVAPERAAYYADLGFTAVKFDPVGPYTVYDPRQLSLETLDRVERYVANVREAVGSRCDLLFGSHGQMTPAAAIRLARRLERFDPLWLEEPTPPENAAAMARVAKATSIPVATGERLATKYEFARLLRADAASILQMNLGRVGGLLEAKKIAGMAEAFYAQIAPHLYCGPIVGAANIQLATCSPNFLILEGIGTWDGFGADLLKEPIRWEDGYVIPPTAPGLGVELDEEVAARHPYRGDRLHLEMGERPLTG